MDVGSNGRPAEAGEGHDLRAMRKEKEADQISNGSINPPPLGR